jgi:hypothetical protein
MSLWTETIFVWQIVKESGLALRYRTEEPPNKSFNPVLKRFFERLVNLFTYPPLFVKKNMHKSWFCLGAASTEIYGIPQRDVRGGS